MKSISRKISSAAMALVIASMPMSVAGCSSMKDRQAAKDITTEYLDAVIAGKFDKAAKCVEDGEDAVSALEIDTLTAQIIDAVMKNASYEIGDVNMMSHKEEYNLTFEFSYVEPEDVFDEEMDVDEFLDALADADDFSEETFTFEFVEDDDEWLITSDSTEDLAEFILALSDGIEFKGLNETTAVALVEQYYDDLGSGNISGAMAIYKSEDYTQEEIMEELAIVGITDDSTEFADYMEAVMSRSEISTEVTEVEDDQITVVATVESPDVNQLTEYLYTEDVMVPLYAEVFYQMFYGDPEAMDLSAAMGIVYTTMTDHMDEVEGTTTTETIFYVMEDEDGELYLTSDNAAESFTGGETFDSAFDASDEDMQQYISQAFDLLLEQGRMSQEDYDLYSAIFAAQ